MTPRRRFLSALTLNAFRALPLSLAASTGLLMPLTAHALGQLAEVQIIDRDSGETLRLHRHQGEYWVAGRPGARYAVQLRNLSPGRTLNVVSVDGVNVVSGETAALNQTGYVLDSWQTYAVAGWRKNDDEVAAFHFTASDGSYASRTGRPAQVGVIGVAVFPEKVAPPPAVSLPHSSRRSATESTESGPTDASGEADSSRTEGLLRQENRPPAAPSPAPMSAADAANGSAVERRMAPASPAPRLGTGHGAREFDRIGRTRFERASQRPGEIIRIRYDSHANLVAMGIIPSRIRPPHPNPFPAPGYVPDPN